MTQKVSIYSMALNWEIIIIYSSASKMAKYFIASSELVTAWSSYKLQFNEL